MSFWRLEYQIQSDGMIWYYLKQEALFMSIVEHIATATQILNANYQSIAKDMGVYQPVVRQTE